MNSIKIIIIDDRVKREALYREVLTQSSTPFEIVKFISKPITDDELSNLRADCIIIDFVLDNGTWPKFGGVEYLLSVLPKNIPKIIISEFWREQITKPTLTKLINNQDYNIIDFLSWEEFEDKNESTRLSLNLRIQNSISNFYKHTIEQKGDDESIYILHISDLQFGDQAYESSVGISFKHLAQWINSQAKIDIVTISGDITFSGQERQYIEATEWLNNFFKSLFGNRLSRERIILVPGNHDIDLHFCAADEYDFDFKTKKFISNSKDVYYNKYSLIPFREFAYNLTNDLQWVMNFNKLSWTIDYFIPWGIRFIILNTAANISHRSDNLFDDSLPINIDNSQLKNIITTYSALATKTYSILVAHHGPKCLGFDGTKVSNWESIREFIETCKINGFFSGHQHHDICRQLHDNDGIYAKKLIDICAPTLALNSSVRPKDARRGFFIVELIRSSGTVSKVKINKYEFEGSKIKQKESEEFQEIIY